MADFDDSVRTDGPTVIKQGPVNATTVLVLDPAGIGKHGELPATWRPLADVVEVLWCRLPAARFDPELVADLLDERGRTGVHLVTSGLTALDAMELARTRDDAVRSVFLVDPDPGPTAELSVDGLRESLLQRAIEVRRIAEHRDPDEDYGSEPLPLGHPAVVRELTQYLG